MHTSRALHVSRGGAAASIATFAALLSHVTGGGAAPGWIGVTVPWLCSVFVCTMLTGRRLSLGRLSAAVVVSQLLFHSLFTLGTPAMTLTPTSGIVIWGGHAMHNVTSSLGMAHTGSTMVVWHGFAALITIAALYRGERAVRLLLELAQRVRDWAAFALRPIRLTPSTRRRPRALVRAATGLVPVSKYFLTASSWRGPPSLHLL